MIAMKLDEVSKVLCEYGAAIRGDWGSIDGRSEQSSIETFADAILKPEKYEAATLRDQADLCPSGSGHWTEHCDDDCEAQS
jgi:hypothetical protein